MKPGGGQAKGANFERQSCLSLSLWVSRGARSDLFVRNVMSGGRYTIAMARDEDHGTPGDIAAAHPTAYVFANLFLVECKSYKNLDWPGFIYDPDKSFLGKVIALCESQGTRSKQHYMVIAKQNGRKPVAIMNGDIGQLAIKSAWPADSIDYHEMHNHRYIVMPFSHMLEHVQIDKFLRGVKDAQ